MNSYTNLYGLLLPNKIKPSRLLKANPLPCWRHHSKYTRSGKEAVSTGMPLTGIMAMWLQRAPWSSNSRLVNAQRAIPHVQLGRHYWVSPYLRMHLSFPATIFTTRKLLTLTIRVPRAMEWQLADKNGKEKKRGKENICLLTTISEVSSDYQKNTNFLVYGTGGYICIGGMSVLVVVIAF